MTLVYVTGFTLFQKITGLIMISKRWYMILKIYCLGTYWLFTSVNLSNFSYASAQFIQLNSARTSKSKNLQENIGCHTCCHEYQTLELKHRFCLHEAGLNSGWILQKAKSNLTFTCNQLPIQLFPCSTISPITDANTIF